MFVMFESARVDSLHELPPVGALKAKSSILRYEGEVVAFLR